MIGMQTAPGRGTVIVLAECACGQDLDSCGRDHCPRCGREIHRAA